MAARSSRAQLGVLLDDSDIHYEWDGRRPEVIPADREAEVESLFEQVGGPAGEDDGDDDGGESRYWGCIEELFAAADRVGGRPGR